jgi:hypothetical protein
MNGKLDLLATSSKQDLLYSKTADAYSVENVINGKLDLLATSSKQTDAYNRLTDVYNTELAISGKLPATLGQKNSAQSLAVTLSSDAYVRLAVLENDYQTIRTFSSTVADTDPPSTGFISLLNATSCGFTEFVWESIVIGGTVKPSEVRFRIWNKVGAVVVKLDDFTIPTSYLELPKETNPLLPRTYPCNSDEVFVSVSFTDGTAGVVTSGTVKARAVTTPGSEYNVKVRNLDTRHEIIETRGYDSATDSIKNSPIMLECDLPLEEALVVDLASITVASGVNYFPSSDGVLMTPYDTISVEHSLTPAVDGYVTLAFQATLGSALWSQVNNITRSGIEYTTGVAHPTATITSAMNTPLTGITHFDNLNVTRFRVAVQALTSTTGALKVSIRRKIR